MLRFLGLVFLILLVLQAMTSLFSLGGLGFHAIGHTLQGVFHLIGGLLHGLIDGGVLLSALAVLVVFWAIALVIGTISLAFSFPFILIGLLVVMVLFPLLLPLLLLAGMALLVLSVFSSILA